MVTPNNAEFQVTPTGFSAPLRKLYPLQARKIIKKCLRGIILVCVMWSIGSFFILQAVQKKSQLPDAGFWSSGKALWMAWVGLLILLLLWRTGYQIIYFLTYHYDFDKDNFLIRKGVIAQREVNLPFSKITDVYVDQDMLDFVFGLYDVHISTPTVESGQFAHIDGVNKEGATALKELILERIRLNR